MEAPQHTHDTKARALLVELVSAWRDAFEQEQEINGGDAVDWLAGFYADAKQVLAEPEPEAKPYIMVGVAGGLIDSVTLFATEAEAIEAAKDLWRDSRPDEDDIKIYHGEQVVWQPDGNGTYAECGHYVAEEDGDEPPCETCEQCMACCTCEEDAIEALEAFQVLGSEMSGNGAVVRYRVEGRGTVFVVERHADGRVTGHASPGFLGNEAEAVAEAIQAAQRYEARWGGGER